MPFDEHYFSTHSYANVTFAKYSMYWWSNRFFAMLARRYGRRGGRLLEVGSGLGHLVAQLEDVFDTTGVDVNHWAVCQSRSAVSRTSLATASAAALPFRDTAFSVVIIKHVVEHLPHPEQAIAELARVIEIGGILILATPNLASLGRSWRGSKWCGYSDPTHISLKPPEQWLGLLKDAGFEARHVFTDGFWDVPYVPVVPSFVQKLIFGAPGGVQAITGIPFLPLRWGESLLVIARRQ